MDRDAKRTGGPRPPPRAPPASRPLVGVGLLLAAMVVLPIMDGLAKELSSRYSLAEVVWARYAFHLAVIAPLVLLRGVAGGRVTRDAPQQLVRGTLLLLATVLFFAAIARMPLADALAVFFVSPLLVTLLAATLLRERVGVRRAVAVAVGFAGVLLVIRPGLPGADPAALLALLAGGVHALYLLATRHLAVTRSPDPFVTLAYSGLVGAVVMSVVVVPFWSGPAPADLGLMVLMGLLAAVGHMLVIAAFSFAPASLLAPIGYAEIVTAVVLGAVWFGDLPDALAWTGILVVIGSGVYVSVRTRPRTPRGGAAPPGRGLDDDGASAAAAAAPGSTDASGTKG